MSISAAVCGRIALASSPSQPLFFFLPLFHQCHSCLKCELIAGLHGFASHRGSILSRDWLATVELSPCEYARHPPSTKQGSWVMFGRVTFKCLKLFYYSKSLPEWQTAFNFFLFPSPWLCSWKSEGHPCMLNIPLCVCRVA